MYSFFILYCCKCTANLFNFLNYFIQRTSPYCTFDLFSPTFKTFSCLMYLRVFYMYFVQELSLSFTLSSLSLSFHFLSTLLKSEYVPQAEGDSFELNLWGNERVKGTVSKSSKKVKLHKQFLDSK